MIHRVERQAGAILVQATDNVTVARVRVTILDGEGKALEKGEAVRRQGDWWQFAPKAEGASILAEAWDLPGHVTKLAILPK